MKRSMVLAFAMGLFAVITDAQTASATVAEPVVATQDAKVAQVTSVNKVQWRRYGPGYRYGWRGGWRPGYRWRPGYGWVPLAAVGVAAAATAGAYAYYGPGPYYGSRPLLLWPRPVPLRSALMAGGAGASHNANAAKGIPLSPGASCAWGSLF